MNMWDAGATQFTETVREFMEENNISRKPGAENGVRETNGPPAQGQKENTAGYGGERYAVDYSKPFSGQLSDYKNGNIRADDALLVGATPDVLKKIGLIGLPMTINQRHVGDVLNGTYKGTLQEKLDHTFTERELGTLPEKIADPIAVIHDKRTGKANVSESNIDVLVEMTAASGKQVIAAVQINGNGRIDGIRIDSNKVATVHGNTDSIARLLDAIKEHEKGNVAVFYINKDKTTKALQRTGNPIPSGLSNLDGFINSITDPNSPVKMRIFSVAESKQFKDWFGNWQKHPENASKVVNADGTPKVVYHGSYKNFSVFDGGAQKHSAAPKGAHFFTDNIDASFSYTGYKEVAKPGGHAYKGGIYPVYLNIRNPLRVDFGGRVWNEKVNGRDVNEWTQFAKDNKYDGLIVENVIDEGGYGDRDWNIDPTRVPATDYVVFDSTQIKSATDNIGTFDGSNPDIRYSVDTISEAEDGRHILYATKGKIKRVGNAKVSSLVIRGSTQNPNSTKTITYPSATVKRLDAEYQYAVSKGDMAMAQKLVEQAAKAVGFVNLFYHGAKKGGGFTEFRDWSYFTENRKYAERYAQRDNAGSLYKTYIKMEKPFDTRNVEEQDIFEEIRGEYGLGEIQDTDFQIRTIRRS